MLLLYGSDKPLPAPRRDELVNALVNAAAAEGFDLQQRDDVPKPDDPETHRCLRAPDCLQDVATRLGMERILAVIITGNDALSAEIRAWTQHGESNVVRLPAGSPEALASVLAGGAKWALRELGRKPVRAKPPARSRPAPELAQASAAQEPAPEPQPTQPAVTITAAAPGGAPASLPPTPPAQMPAVDAGVEIASESSETERWFGVSAGPGFMPFRHEQTDLVAGEQIDRATLGAAGVDVSLAVRLPSLPSEPSPFGSSDTSRTEIWVTTGMSYGLVAPLFAASWDLGIEQRWINDAYQPVLGMRYLIAWLGLPVEHDGSRHLALTRSYALEPYAGAAVPLTGSWSLSLEGGYRFALRTARIFRIGDAAYYARLPDGKTWQVNVSGPSARAHVNFTF